ncbi:MarR family winged helix-turn-helix transcriptional regulator [Streptomyces sp. NPDC048172]|uniref:MarR family winged helix-turn-helix transcriptional regulator n=1 Tax=Streptomyces sp. NPDC048172 TaxID=3365505 RepID=UPI003715F8D5
MSGESSAHEEEAVRAWSAMRAFVLETADKRRQVTEALGMSYFRAKALRMIGKKGPLTLRELAAGLYADAPYTTVTVEHLVQRGLVTRTPHPADRRSKLVQVTEEGAAAVAEMVRLSDAPPEALRALPPEDLAALDRILSVLTGGPEER